MAAPILIVQHAPAEGPGLLAAPLEEAGNRIEIVRAFEGGPVPEEAGGFARIVLLGGPMAVYEADRHPHLAAEIALAADALRRACPVLGVCLGAQILAAAAGARVHPGPKKEIGWYPIALTEEGRRDPVLGTLPAGPVVFHWHGDTFDLPRRAALLASSAACPHQAFRIGACAYGLQFHIEVTPGMVDSFLEAGAGEAVDFGGAAGAARIRSEARRHAAALAGYTQAIVRAFLRT